MGSKETQIDKPNEIGSADLQSLPEQLVTAEAKLSILRERLNKRAAQVPDTIIDFLYEKFHSLEIGEVTEEQLLNTFPEIDKPEYWIVADYIEGMHLMHTIAELQERHKPMKIQELTEYAQGVYARFNWDAFLTYYEDNVHKYDPWDNGLLPNGLASVARLRQIIVKAQQGTLGQEDYQQLDNWHSYLIEQHEEWAKRGFINESPVSTSKEVSTEEITQRRNELKERLQSVIYVLDEYGNLKSKFRNPVYDYRIDDRVLKQVTEALDLDRGYGYTNEIWKEVEYDPRLLDAVEKFISRKIQEYVDTGLLPQLGEDYTQFLEKARTVELEKALKAIQVVGLEQNQGQELVVSETHLKHLLEKSVPAFFLDKIKSIVVMEKPEDLDEDNQNTNGEYIPVFDDKGNLVESRIKIYSSPYVPEDADHLTNFFVRNKFETVLLHEIAHNIHHVLPYIDMLNWEQVMEIDKTEVTWYVGYVREKYNKLSSGEDFSETFQMLVLNPGYLSVCSPVRFNYMLSLIVRYMNNEQREVFVADIQQKIEDYKKGAKELAKLITENAPQNKNE